MAPCTTSALDAAAGHPHGEAEWVVIAADDFDVAAIGELRAGRAAEFAAPDDERVFEQAAWLSDP